MKTTLSDGGLLLKYVLYLFINLFIYFQNVVVGKFKKLYHRLPKLNIRI